MPPAGWKERAGIPRSPRRDELYPQVDDGRGPVRRVFATRQSGRTGQMVYALECGHLVNAKYEGGRVVWSGPATTANCTRCIGRIGEQS